MGEYGGYVPPEARVEVSPVRETELPAEREAARELVVNISREALNESQSSYAVAQGFENFEKMPAISRANFWALESGVRGNHRRAEKAAKEAGLDPKSQLEYKIKALKTRMTALARSTDRGNLDEFYKLDRICQASEQKLTELK